MKNRQSIFPVLLLLAAAGMNGLLFGEENRRTAADPDRGADVSCCITPEEPVLADTLAMTLTLTAGTGTTGTFPDFGGRYGDFRVERSKDEPVQTAEGRTIFSRTYFLKPTRPGEGTLPPIPVEITQKTDAQNNNTQKSVLLIPAGSLTIQSSRQPEDASLESFAPARGAVSRWGTILTAAAAGLLLMLAVFYAVVRKIHKREKAAEKEPVLSPYERAEQEINALEASKLWIDDVKQFYQRLTGTVRWFIEETTGLKAPERTTEEFLREAERSGRFDSETKQHLARFLEFADLVKFAKFHPEEPDIFDGLQKARDFVREPVSTEPDTQNNDERKDLTRNKKTPEPVPEQGEVR